MAKKSLDRVISDTASALSRYFEGGAIDTGLLRETAAGLVELRSRFHRKDGSTDWGGRTADYRAAVRDVYTRAHIPAEQADGIHSKIYYHVRQALDDRVPTTELEDAGFNAANPKQAQQERRRTNSAIAATIATEVTPAQLIVWAHNLLQRAVNSPDLAEMTAKERAACRMALTAITEDAATLSAAVSDTARN